MSIVRSYVCFTIQSYQVFSCMPLPAGTIVVVKKTHKKDVQKFHTKVCKIINSPYHSLVEYSPNVYTKQCINLTNRILSDPTHPLSPFFSFLPSGKRLNMIHSSTNRSCNSFVTINLL